MKSLDTILAESIGKMSDAAKNAFAAKRQKGMTQESLIALAESVLDDFPSQRQKITRNNGGQRQATEAEEQESKLEDAFQEFFTAMESARPHTSKGIGDMREVGGQLVRRDPNAGTRLTESQHKDYEEAKLFGFSESDALRIAKTNL